MKRRELLWASAALCGGCATMPSPYERLADASADAARDRRCDHDLCRCWRPTQESVAAPGEHRMGRCAIGLPEDL